MVGITHRSSLHVSILPALFLLSASLLSAHPAAGQSPYLNTLYSFSVENTNQRNNDGAQPVAGLIQASDGNFYGATSNGGVNGDGTIFKVTHGGTFTTLHSFSALSASYTNVDGANPTAGLIQASDGNFYGTTSNGGKHGYGTVFEYTSTGAFKTLYSFSAEGAGYVNVDGASPATGLIQARDGNLYGTCQFGGANGAGTIFKIALSGKFTTLFSFNDLVNGGQPLGSLFQGSDGAFYGTTSEGGNGTGGGGTLFRITPAGKFSDLWFFSVEKPASSLIQGSDGAYYGTDQLGGDNGVGEVYKITTAGTFTSLYSFSALDSEGDNVDGALPATGLIQGSDGAFYGTAEAGGVFNHGTVFKVTPGGTLTTLYNFGNQNDGASPFAQVIQGSDGSLYGTCSAGGASGNGTLFQLNPGGYGIIALSPSHVSAPAPNTLLTVTGNGLKGGAVIMVGNTVLTTTFVNSNTLTATVPAAGLASPAWLPVTVVQNRVTSNVQPFTIVSRPILALLSPGFVAANAPNTLLTVTGSGFTGSAYIIFGNAALTTTVVNSSTLTATIPAASLAKAAKVPVSVGQSGVISNGLAFNIVTPTLTLTPKELTRNSAKNVVVAFYVSNTGSVTAPAVTITAATLSAQNAITQLPIKLGTIAAGKSLAAELKFPSTVGTKGETVTFTVSGTYTGGTFMASITVKLP